MSDLTAQRDQWQNFGFVYGRSGTTRGTTTSSGVISVKPGFARQVVFAQAYDEATHLRITQTGGGPAQTQGTFYTFLPITHSTTLARFRVLVFNHGGSNGTFTLASTTTGVTFKWLAHGY